MAFCQSWPPRGFPFGFFRLFTGRAGLDLGECGGSEWTWCLSKPMHPQSRLQTPGLPWTQARAPSCPPHAAHLHLPFQIPAGSLVVFSSLLSLPRFPSRFISNTLVLSFRPCLSLALLFFSLLDALFSPLGWCQPCDLVLEFCLGLSEHHAGVLAFEGHRVALFLSLFFPFVPG